MSLDRRGLVLGIDASRCRSGGAIDHLIGILSSVDPIEHGIDTVHLWSHKQLNEAVPDRVWLKKHTPRALSRCLLSQLFWQATSLAGELKSYGCNVLFSADANTVSLFKPKIVLSQDLIVYEDNTFGLYIFGIRKLRHLVNFFVQTSAFKNSAGVIFLTEHARRRIESFTGLLQNTRVVLHGVNSVFRQTSWLPRSWVPERRFSLVYVSPIWIFKHQDNVIRAVHILKEKGFHVHLTLVGNCDLDARHRTNQVIEACGLSTDDVHLLGHIPHSELPVFLVQFDIFVFASSCESFGITLLEGMALGMPIACSNLSSLPETLKDGGVYFDPLDPIKVANAIESLMRDEQRALEYSVRARQLSYQYSWPSTANRTFEFIRETFESTTGRII